MEKIKSFIRRLPFIRRVLYSSYMRIAESSKAIKVLKILKKNKKTDNKIFYLGAPAHSNLGDLAQGVCIRKWIKKHYPERKLIEIETNILLNSTLKIIKKMKKSFSENDFIIFQSGYTTTDLGGRADEMHRKVIEMFPKAKILMMPQTIFFKSSENKKRTSESYNKAENMLFLARDRKSYESALEMFPDIRVELYPDIVTTLIGSRENNYERNGILFCCRNDSEKYYSDQEINTLMEKCKTLDTVEKTDTTKIGSTKEVVASAEKFIMQEIEKYSHYKLIITDRYHGTILSLIAGTPVIIIKTTDHKVTTGADWFKGIYDEYVYKADNLEEVYELAKNIYNKSVNYKLEPYFEKEYYDKLPEKFKKLHND